MAILDNEGEGDKPMGKTELMVVTCMIKKGETQSKLRRYHGN